MKQTGLHRRQKGRDALLRSPNLHSSLSLKITNRISVEAKRERVTIKINKPNSKVNNSPITSSVICLISSFSDSEGAGGEANSFAHWPLVPCHLLPPITPSLCLSPSPRVQLWTRRIVLFDDLTSLSVTETQTQRHAHTPTHPSHSLAS